MENEDCKERAILTILTSGGEGVCELLYICVVSFLAQTHIYTQP